MRRILLPMSLLLVLATASAQVTEHFDDGDFTAAPSWTGNTSDFIVNASGQLQSNNTTASSSFYISTANSMITATQWEFYVRLDFNTSSTNYADIFLAASASDLSDVNTNGYFVRIGNTSDEISLYKKSGSTVTKIIDGTDDITNVSSNTLKIKVIRNASDQWILYRDVTGTGSNYVSEGSVTDNSYSSSAYFGFLIKQSTASFFQKHFFDDIEIKAYEPDVTAPSIISAVATSTSTVEVLFNEPVDAASAQSTANYTAGNAVGNPATVSIDGSNPALVHLTFSNAFPGNTTISLTVNGVKDMEGNTLTNGSSSFSFYTPQQYDVVIDEIMCDPTPQLGLPNNEWIELRNISAFPVNIKNWKIADGSGTSGALPSFMLQPDSFVIVCTGSAVAAMSPFGTTISVSSFPSLDNDGETISLITDQGLTMHAVNYNISWYKNELKKDGGWTLEMIDTKNPCSGSSNWKASENLQGGSPGKKNSVDGANPDTDAPKLLRAYATDSLNIILVFDEPLSSAASAANYSIGDGISIDNVTAASLVTDRVKLLLTTPLVRNKIYTITVNGLSDCAGNTIGNRKTARVGLSEVADSLDIVINEILFNPPTNGTDYVEIYNRSKKIIDLGQTYIANRNSSAQISSISKLSNEPYLLFPEDFMVITEDPAIIKSLYITQNPDAFVTVASMPSYNDDAGDVIILNAQGEITDELKYSEKWHFSLINNREGVSLERIDYNAPTQLQDNWHSAATSVGYGTPTYKNSQFKINDEVKGEVKISPEIVSPDNDGQDDFAAIDYSFPAAGYIANITVFDATGRPVKLLQRNALCGVKGSFRWDGLGDKGQQLTTGIYVILTEIFNLQGKKKVFKNSIVVARRN